MIILGIDASSTTVGICVIDSKKPKNNNIELLMFFKLDKFITLYEKGNEFILKIADIVRDYKVEQFVIEDFLKSYSGGMTSKNVIIKLAQCSGIFQFVLQNEFNSIPITMLNVRSSRSKVVGKIPQKKIIKMSAKEFVFEYFKNNFSHYNHWLIKNGKGNYIEENKDMVDAWCIAQSFISGIGNYFKSINYEFKNS